MSALIRPATVQLTDFSVIAWVRHKEIQTVTSSLKMSPRLPSESNLLVTIVHYLLPFWRHWAKATVGSQQYWLIKSAYEAFRRRHPPDKKCRLHSAIIRPETWLHDATELNKTQEHPTTVFWEMIWNGSLCILECFRDIIDPFFTPF